MDTLFRCAACSTGNRHTWRQHQCQLSGEEIWGKTLLCRLRHVAPWSNERRGFLFYFGRQRSGMVHNRVKGQQHTCWRCPPLPTPYREWVLGFTIFFGDRTKVVWMSGQDWQLGQPIHGTLWALRNPSYQVVVHYFLLIGYFAVGCASEIFACSEVGVSVPLQWQQLQCPPNSFKAN